jgi:hypothetical protein
MATGAIELSSAVRFLNVDFRCEKPFDVTRELLVQAVATSQFSDEIRAKYFREEGFSVVQAIVHVESGMGGFFKFEARVFVRVKYQGDMVRISPADRTTVSNRFDELAQKHCVYFVFANFMEGRDVPLIPGWHGVPAEEGDD